MNDDEESPLLLENSLDEAIEVQDVTFDCFSCVIHSPEPLINPWNEIIA